MRKYDGLPELLEQFMQAESSDERWVTVQELRDRFGLTRYQCNTVSGFLRRLHAGTFGQCPYIVLRIELIQRTKPSHPPKYRYLVKYRVSAIRMQGIGSARDTGVGIKGP